MTDGAGKRAATWRLWIQASQWGEEIYLACRELRGSIHTSFHASGEWHTAFSPEAHQDLNHENSLPEVLRKFDEWPRPPEVQPGITLAHKILTPWGSATTPFAEAKPGLIQIPTAATGKANETMILIVRPGLELDIRNADLIRQISLSNGGKLIVVNRAIKMPQMPSQRGITPRYFRGKSNSDVAGEHLRALVITSDGNGHRMLLDAAVEAMAHGDQD